MVGDLQTVHVKPKTLELLYFLSWNLEKIGRPNFRNLTESYESWAYRKGLHRQLDCLEHAKLVEVVREADQRIVRLTEKGWLLAVGGRNPEERWSRKWDGRWRLILFDIPREQSGLRQKLRRYLKARGYGYLQFSFWVSPDKMDPEIKLLAGETVDVQSLLMMDAIPAAGEKDSQIVQAAWDFTQMNQAYSECAKVRDAFPHEELSNPVAAKQLQKWAAEERAAWNRALELDPLLPRKLHPSEYLGPSIWTRRLKIFQQAGSLLRKFSP